MLFNTNLIEKKHMNIKMKTSLIILAATLASTAPQFAQAQKFYKWVDSSGSTHYTTTPPPRNAKKLGNVSTYNDTPSGQSYTPTPPPESTTQASNQQATNQPANRQASNQSSNSSESERPSTPTQNQPNNSNSSNERITLPQVGEDPTRGQEQILNTGRNLL